MKIYSKIFLVKVRFLAIFSALYFLIYSTDSYLKDIEIELLNSIFSNMFISIILTSFGILVTCNAWNFIDGVNGLSSGLGASTLFIFSLISGDIYIDGFREFLSLTSFVFFGFCLLNLFTGKFF